MKFIFRRGREPSDINEAFDNKQLRDHQQKLHANSTEDMKSDNEDFFDKNCSKLGFSRDFFVLHVIFM